MNPQHFDVLIIGAGPAGSLAAYHLAKAGLRVAVVEAARFPRPKACGGGLQVRAVRHIPFDIAPVLRATLSSLTLTFRLAEEHSRCYHSPIVHTVLRAEFDDFLLQQAIQAGAVMLAGHRVAGIEWHPARVAISGEGFRLTGDCLVAADGANSVMARRLNARSNYFWQVGVYADVPMCPPEGQQSVMRIDWGTVPGGYAWAFPKMNYVNLGAGASVAIGRYLRQYASRFAETQSALPRALRLPFSGHHLPTLTKRAVLASDRVVLVGDAAGLVDPFTGEGISNACYSASVAATAVVDALGRGSTDMRSYEEQIKASLSEEFAWSRRLLTFSTAFPRLIYRVFRSNDRAWEIFCRALRGEESFRRLAEEIFGSMRFALGPLETVARLIERHSLRRYSCPLPETN